MSSNTPIGTLSFPALYKPRPPAPGAEPRFSCSVLFDEDAQKDPEFKAMKTAVLAVAKEKWGDKAAELFKSGKIRTPFRDGNDKEYQGYQDTIYVNFWSKNKPEVIDGRLQDAMESDVFAGAKARVNYSCFAYDVSGNMGVSFGLNAVQIGDTSGPRLDGRKPAKDVFGTLDVPETATAGGEDEDDDLPF